MKNKNTILIWIIAILVILNLSIVGTILYNKSKKFSGVKIQNKEVVIPNNHLGQFFREELNLSFKQHRKFRSIRQLFHQNANEIKSKMQENRNNILIELGKNQSDTIYLNQLSSNLGNLHNELKKLSINYYLDMKKECNQDQKEKLYQIFQAMIDNEGNIEMPKKQ